MPPDPSHLGTGNVQCRTRPLPSSSPGWRISMRVATSLRLRTVGPAVPEDLPHLVGRGVEVDRVLVPLHYAACSGSRSLHRRRESVLPAPVVLEVLVPLDHEVVQPPEPVDPARHDRHDDPRHVVLASAQARWVGWCSRGTEPVVDLGELGLDRALGVIVGDEVTVEQAVGDEARDGAREEVEDQPNRRIAELRRLGAQDGHARRDALERGRSSSLMPWAVDCSHANVVAASRSSTRRAM